MAKTKRKPLPTVISLGQVAAHLTKEFKLNYPIGYMTPYDWWWRREGIEPAFPEPVLEVGRNRFFDPGEIVEWYGKFKGWEAEDTP